MQDIKYSTESEKRMIVGIQEAMNALGNGWIGNQTLSEIAKRYCPEIFPLSLRIYNMPVIISKEILIFNPNGALKNYNNSVSGSYTYPAGKTPNCIMINKGVTISSASAHSWAGFPDSVIYKLNSGEIKICRAVYDKDIPNRSDVKWAISGAGLLNNYNPKLEGYSSFTVGGKSYNYSDVWRRTNHIVLGVSEDDWLYGVYISNMNGSEINNFCKNKMKFKYALKLDGGHIPAIKSDEFNINTSISQGSAIQFIKG